jgi:MFS family permease
MLPIGLSPVFFAALAATLMTRMGKYRTLNSIGVTFLLTGMLAMSTLTENSRPWQTVGYQFIPAIGIGILFPTRSMMIQSGQSRDEDVPISAAVSSMMINLGQCLGQALGTTIWQNTWNHLVNQSITSDSLQKSDSILANDLERNIFKIRTLEHMVREIYRHIGAVSVARIWLVMSGFSVIGLVASFFVLDLPFKRDTRTKLAYGRDSNNEDVPLLPTATLSRTRSTSPTARDLPPRGNA